MKYAKENDKWTVYVHIVPKNIRKANNDKYYVGITKQKPKRRWQNGIGYKGQLFYRAIQKYGWNNIEHEIIAENLTKDEAKNFEKVLIASLNTRDHNFGYNCTDGGDGCVNLSEESRKKVGKAQKGKIISEETRKKLIESHSRKVYQFDFNGILIREWKGTYEIKQELGYTKTVISACCSHRSNQAYGFLWSYDKNDDRIYKNSRIKKVQQYDFQGNYIKEYKSITEAERETGINHTNIMACCRYRLKSAGGYQWKYADDNTCVEPIKFSYKIKKVRQLTLDGISLTEFESMSKASKDTGINQQHISEVCRGKRKSAGGYRWEFINDNIDILVS